MLKGKSALITGSTSGIGLAIATALARDGCNVMLNGLADAAEMADIAAGLTRDHGVKAAFNDADMSKPDEVAALVGATAEELGGVDILVNNAGIQHTAPVHEFPTEMWDAIIAINLSAVFHAIRAALPPMRERGWGRVVNTASVHGLVASVNKAAYVAAKHGIVGLTKSVALENAGTGVTCNAVCPGWVRTELIERQIAARAAEQGIEIEAGARDILQEKQPSQQFVTVEQVAGLVVFLCSDAAAQITGVAVPIDGGWTAQ
ncbi:MAG: 3-hydroxybutyrate dehydrogenase [Alphaproteobacteria bacterium]|nr:3-hydroxybutyrate dehydrogenase [Alphaproteobacteria bacterium]